MNALLGEQVLPTSHNAATSVLCELKHSGDSSTKYAVVHFAKGKGEERLELTRPEGLTKLASFINQSRDDGLLGTIANLSFEKLDKLVSGRPKCVKVEVYWPLEFLKVSVMDGACCVVYTSDFS